MLSVLSRAPRKMSPRVTLGGLPKNACHCVLAGFCPGLEDTDDIRLLEVIPIITPPIIGRRVGIMRISAMGQAPRGPIMRRPGPYQYSPPLVTVGAGLTS